MGTFKSSKIYYALISLILIIADDVEKEFIGKGFEVNKIELLSAGYNISIIKGNTFKAVLGMKSALNVLIHPQEGNIYIDAGGRNIWATNHTYSNKDVICLASPNYPVWRIVQQTKMDDKVMQIVKDFVQRNSNIKSTKPET